jgi:hypothetical protein
MLFCSNPGYLNSLLPYEDIDHDSDLRLSRSACLAQFIEKSNLLQSPLYVLDKMPTQ